MERHLTRSTHATILVEALPVLLMPSALDLFLLRWVVMAVEVSEFQVHSVLSSDSSLRMLDLLPGLVPTTHPPVLFKDLLLWICNPWLLHTKQSPSRIHQPSSHH